MGVGVMLEIARVLVERNQAFDGTIIFCECFRSVWQKMLIWSVVWNGAEGTNTQYVYANSIETLQDGSHLYSTQHETAKT